jgi:hypothetical protein
MNKRKINFLSKRINNNKFCLLSGIEMVNDDFYAEDISYKNYDKIAFKILNILSEDKINSFIKDFRLKINICILNKEYTIVNWFRYNYKTKEFECSEDGYLQV